MQKVQVVLLDDLHGGEADETVSFALDGVAFEIDLTSQNAARLREALVPYLSSARRVSGRSQRAVRGARPSRPVGTSEEAAKIRVWAREHGYEVHGRGRVPAEVRAAYEEAAR